MQSAPNIKDRITEQGVIEGTFTPEEANDLALVLRAGALPAGLTYLEERTVGPSLGLDSIKKGIPASVVGALLVFVAIVALLPPGRLERDLRPHPQRRAPRGGHGACSRRR